MARRARGVAAPGAGGPWAPRHGPRGPGARALLVDGPVGPDGRRPGVGQGERPVAGLRGALGGGRREGRTRRRRPTPRRREPSRLAGHRGHRVADVARRGAATGRRLDRRHGRVCRGATHPVRPRGRGPRDRRPALSRGPGRGRAWVAHLVDAWERFPTTTPVGSPTRSARRSTTVSAGSTTLRRRWRRAACPRPSSTTTSIWGMPSGDPAGEWRTSTSATRSGRTRSPRCASRCGSCATGSPSARTIPSCARATDAYLGPWTDPWDLATLRALLPHAERLSCLHRAESWRRLQADVPLHRVDEDFLRSVPEWLLDAAAPDPYASATAR